MELLCTHGHTQPCQRRRCVRVKKWVFVAVLILHRYMSLDNAMVAQARPVHSHVLCASIRIHRQHPL